MRIGNAEIEFVALNVLFKAALDDIAFVCFKDIAFEHKRIQLAGLGACSVHPAIAEVNEKTKSDDQNDDGVAEDLLSFHGVLFSAV